MKTDPDGLTIITTHSPKQRLRLGLLLIFRYGFWRWGRIVAPGTDDAIYPSFIRWRKRITSFGSGWTGYSLAAENAETDAFLRQFYERHCGKERTAA
jgi:hypothetical protein